jgi:hypothetical protein
MVVKLPDRCLFLPVSADHGAACLCERRVGIGSTGNRQPVSEALEDTYLVNKKDK